MFCFSSTSTPKPLFYRTILRPFFTRLYLCLGLPWPRCKTLPMALLRFMIASPEVKAPVLVLSRRELFLFLIVSIVSGFTFRMRIVLIIYWCLSCFWEALTLSKTIQLLILPWQWGGWKDTRSWQGAEHWVGTEWMGACCLDSCWVTAQQSLWTASFPPTC